jgi:hypothetical protein
MKRALPILSERVSIAPACSPVPSAVYPQNETFRVVVRRVRGNRHDCYGIEDEFLHISPLTGEYRPTFMLALCDRAARDNTTDLIGWVEFDVR